MLTLFVSSAYVSDTVSDNDTKMSVLTIEIAWHDDLFKGIRSQAIEYFCATRV